MEDQIQKLRDSGFNDQEIQDWVAEQKTKSTTESSSGAVKPNEEQDVPFAVTPTAPVPESNMATHIATAGTGLGNVSSSDIAKYGAEAYAVKKLVVDPAKGLYTKVTNRLGGPAVPTVSSSGVQTSGIGSPNQPIGGPVAPTAEAPPARPPVVEPSLPKSPGFVEPTGPRVVAQIDQPGMMNSIKQLFQKYGPAIGEHLTHAGQVIADSKAGQLAGAVASNPVVKGVARVAGTPLLAAQLLTESKDLNHGEQAALDKIHQQEFYKKYAQAIQEMKNKDPNAQNAINSGFAEQLNNSQ